MQLGAVGKEAEDVVLGHEIGAFVLATQLIVFDKDAEESVVLVDEELLDALAERNNLRNDLVHLQVRYHFHKNFGSRGIYLTVLLHSVIRALFRQAVFFVDWIDIGLQRGLILARSFGVVGGIKVYLL